MSPTKEKTGPQKMKKEMETKGKKTKGKESKGKIFKHLSQNGFVDIPQLFHCFYKLIICLIVKLN